MHTTVYRDHTIRSDMDGHVITKADGEPLVFAGDTLDDAIRAVDEAVDGVKLPEDEDTLRDTLR